ncbi:uncharacterized protein LOC133835860 [Drosophila sulfurigaster albostrigata]|uniref:uncharacterized protein LOC133835860 n=1 Tax=Drosophila sulfurigaster albostrigata TaxID=89887 RepID=UPI002D21B742|nr:uncharacterized protein LOC133835860 [Drosophila sulfurigaster albostrigata]
MRQLMEMMSQLMGVQRQNTSTVPSQQPLTMNSEIQSPDSNNVCSQGQQVINTARQASVKEIANTLPEFDPSDKNAITAKQFIDRVNKVVDAYNWDQKCLLLAIYTRLKGPAKMWLDSSSVVHTRWSNFAEALNDEFGIEPDEAEIHFTMANATRKSNKTVKEYCFRMSSLGVRYKLSEAAVIRYVRAGLQHRELQNSIAAIQFYSMKQLRNATENFFMNRSRLSENKRSMPPKDYSDNQKGEVNAKSAKQKEALKCYNCGESGHFANSCPKPPTKTRCSKCNKFHARNENCQSATVMRVGTLQPNMPFLKNIVVNSHCYVAFIDSGSEASIVRRSVAKEIKAVHSKCAMQIRGICGGTCMSTEAIRLEIVIDGKSVSAKVYIVEDEILPEDFLLGQDVIADIIIESGKIVSQAPYRVPEPKKEIVSQMVNELLEHDIITQCTSEYASPVVLIKKPNGSDRLCIDYRRLNKLIQTENFPMPHIEEKLQEAKRHKWFSSLDLNTGYYQVEIAPSSRKYTAFITTDGLYEFKRLPFGLKNAPAVFNRLMAELQKRVQKDDIIYNMDDILIDSQTCEEMYEKLERILLVLRECGLTLNLNKCELFKKSINFLGHKIHEDGISPGEIKTNAIAMFPSPKNITDPFKWEKSQQDAFDELKKCPTTKPVITCYRLDAYHELHTDASAVGLAGVLLQKEADQMKPIAYYSRATSKAEKNYHSY